MRQNGNRGIGDEATRFQSFEKAELVLGRCAGSGAGKGKEINNMHA